MALIAVLIIAIVGHGASGAGSPVKNANTFVTLRYRGPESLDPGYAFDAFSEEVIYPNAYETLVTYAGSMLSRYVPILATQVPSLANGLISADGLTYTFPIRKGVTFHDGSPMTPEDVRYSMLRFMLQDRDGGPSWLLLSPLVGKDSTRDKGKVAVIYEEVAPTVTVRGDNVVFHLKHPTGAFLSIIAAWSFVMPKAWAAAHGDWDGSAATWQKFNNPKLQDRYAFDHVNGTGPFKLQGWDRQGNEVILVRNDRYWRTPPTLTRVVIRPVPEFTTRQLALQHGDADFITVDRRDQRKVEGMAGVTIRDDLPILGVQALHFNFKIDPKENPDIGTGTLDRNGIPLDFFTDIHIRRGFAYAFDYLTFMRDAYRGKAIQASGPLIQGLLGYDPSAPKYVFDKDRAVAEFKAAWGGKVWDTGFKMAVAYNTGEPTRRIALELLKEAIESLNPRFEIQIRHLPWPAFVEMTRQHKGTLYPLGWIADYPDPDDLAEPFLASSGFFARRSSYNNPEVDALVREGAVTTAPAQRAAIYRHLTKIVYDDVPQIYTVQPTGFAVMRSWVHGWYYNAILPGLDYYPLYKE